MGREYHLSRPDYARAEPERARRYPPGGIATPSIHPLAGDLVLSRHAGAAGRGDRGLLAGGQSAAPRENDYPHGQRDERDRSARYRPGQRGTPAPPGPPEPGDPGDRRPAGSAGARGSPVPGTDADQSDREWDQI